MFSQFESQTCGFWNSGLHHRSYLTSFLYGHKIAICIHQFHIKIKCGTITKTLLSLFGEKIGLYGQTQRIMCLYRTHNRKEWITKMSSQTPSVTQKGEAFERLLLAMAAHSPVRTGRTELIESPFLSSFHASIDTALETLAETAKPPSQLTDNEKRNAAKALGRMISSDAVREVLVPNGHDERVNLPESGLVAVSLSLPVLQNQHRKWVEDGRKGRKPSQELIADIIRLKTVKWIIDKRDDEGIPLFLNDIWVVHGSNSIDMLVQVAYRSALQFMHYVRDVIQQVEGVLGTQTMQISNDLSENHIHYEDE